MKKLLTLSLLQLVYLVFAITSSQPILAETVTNIEQKKSILVVGDSLSAAYGLKEGTGWVDLLSNRLSGDDSGWVVNNASISGETTTGGEERITKLLKTHQPEIVILELGANDGLRGFPLQITYNNLQKMIQLSQQSNAKVLLAGIYLPPNYGEKYSVLFYKNFTLLAEKHSLIFIPYLLKDLTKELFQDDGLHPKEAAQGIILDNVWPLLKPLL